MVFYSDTSWTQFPLFQQFKVISLYVREFFVHRSGVALKMFKVVIDLNYDKL